MSGFLNLSCWESMEVTDSQEDTCAPILRAAGCYGAGKKIDWLYLTPQMMWRRMSLVLSNLDREKRAKSDCRDRSWTAKDTSIFGRRRSRGCNFKATASSGWDYIEERPLILNRVWQGFRGLEENAR